MEITFKNLRIDDKVYCLKGTLPPKMVSYQVIGVNKTYKDTLQIIVMGNESSFTFMVPKDFTDSSQYKQYYLIKKDCRRKLEEICLQGIITLFKAVGGSDES